MAGFTVSTVADAGFLTAAGVEGGVMVCGDGVGGNDWAAAKRSTRPFESCFASAYGVGTIALSLLTTALSDGGGIINGFTWFGSTAAACGTTAFTATATGCLSSVPWLSLRSAIASSAVVETPTAEPACSGTDGALVSFDALLSRGAPSKADCVVSVTASDACVSTPCVLLGIACGLK